MALTPWLASYPFSDPYFQYFTVQQYLSPSVAINPVQVYTGKDPDELVSVADQKDAGIPADKTVTMAEQKAGAHAPRPKAPAKPKTNVDDVASSVAAKLSIVDKPDTEESK